MENASKALIIAASVLVAIMIVALGVSIFNKAQSSTDLSALDATEINMFNQKFERYDGNQLGSQVKSLISYVISNASTNKDDPAKLLSVQLYNDNNADVKNNAEGESVAYNDLKTYMDTLGTIRSSLVSTRTYSVHLDYSDTGLIELIQIKVGADASFAAITKPSGAGGNSGSSAIGGTGTSLGGGTSASAGGSSSKPSTGGSSASSGGNSGTSSGSGTSTPSGGGIDYEQRLREISQNDDYNSFVLYLKEDLDLILPSLSAKEKYEYYLDWKDGKLNSDDINNPYDNNPYYNNPYYNNPYYNNPYYNNPYYNNSYYNNPYYNNSYYNNPYYNNPYYNNPYYNANTNTNEEDKYIQLMENDNAYSMFVYMCARGGLNIDRSKLTAKEEYEEFIKWKANNGYTN